MPQMLIITIKNVSIVGSFLIDDIEVFDVISLSNFNKPHTLSGNDSAVSDCRSLDSGPRKLCILFSSRSSTTEEFTQIFW